MHIRRKPDSTSKRNHMPESLKISNLILDQMNTGYPHEGTGYLNRVSLRWMLIAAEI